MEQVVCLMMSCEYAGLMLYIQINCCYLYMIIHEEARVKGCSYITYMEIMKWILLLKDCDYANLLIRRKRDLKLLCRIRDGFAL